MIEARSAKRLQEPNVHYRSAEEELPVQVGGVDGVHVDDMNAAEPRKRQALEQIAPKPSSADAQDLAILAQKLHRLGGGAEVGEKHKNDEKRRGTPAKHSVSQAQHSLTHPDNIRLESFVGQRGTTPEDFLDVGPTPGHLGDTQECQRLGQLGKDKFCLLRWDQAPGGSGSHVDCTPLPRRMT